MTHFLDYNLLLVLADFLTIHMAIAFCVFCVKTGLLKSGVQLGGKVLD